MQIGCQVTLLVSPSQSLEISLCDFVAVNKDVVPFTFQALKDKLCTTSGLEFDAIILSNVLEGGNSCSLIASGLGLNLVIKDLFSYSKYLACSSGDKGHSGSGKFQRNLRRLENRLNGKGDVSWQYIHDVQEQLDTVSQFLDLEASGWKGEDGTNTAIKSNPRVIAFYHELIELFWSRGSHPNQSIETKWQNYRRTVLLAG